MHSGGSTPSKLKNLPDHCGNRTRATFGFCRETWFTCLAVIAGIFFPGNENLFQVGRTKTAGRVVTSANAKKSNALDIANLLQMYIFLMCTRYIGWFIWKSLSMSSFPLSSGCPRDLKILESPWIGKKIPGLKSPWKSVEVLESPGINFLNLQLCQH